MLTSENIDVKICCIKSLEEAKMAAQAGASAIGLVGPMPSGPGVIDNTLIRLIAEQMNQHLGTFLLSSEQSASEIIAHYDQCKTNTIQLVDHVNYDDLKKIRDRLPGVRLVQVLHIAEEKNIEEAIRVSQLVDGILLDSGNPSLQVKELGGTGRIHDWTISKRIVESVDVPVLLAGGLKPSNVGEAITAVRPAGVDLCSGIRVNGVLNEGLLSTFMDRVRSVTI